MSSEGEQHQRYTKIHERIWTTHRGKINNYLLHFFSNLFEQFWATYSFLEDDSDENLRAAFDTIIHDLVTKNWQKCLVWLKILSKCTIQMMLSRMANHFLSAWIGLYWFYQPEKSQIRAFRNLTVMQKITFGRNQEPHTASIRTNSNRGYVSCRYHNQKKGLLWHHIGPFNVWMI